MFLKEFEEETYPTTFQNILSNIPKYTERKDKLEQSGLVWNKTQ